MASPLDLRLPGAELRVTFGSKVPRPRAKLKVTLVRGPFVATVRAASNEATPALGLAHIAAYLRQRDYDVTIVDALGEDLARSRSIHAYPGTIIEGLPFPDVVDRDPSDSDGS